MRSVATAAALVFGAALHVSQDTIRIGPVDFYGAAGIDIGMLRSRLPVHAGDTVRESELKPRREQIEKAIADATGRGSTDLALTCCTADGRVMLYVGLAGANYRMLTHRAKPTGSACLPQTAVDRYTRALDANLAAAEKGDTAEDDSGGYALGANPELRSAQLQLRDFAIGHVPAIIRALQRCADDGQREAAAMLLGYADRSKDQIGQLIQSANDADAIVRNNSLRALEVLAAAPAGGAAIRADGLIGMLNSGEWTDRNKAGLLFMRLTQSRDVHLLASLARQAFDSLVEMARWQDLPHAMPYRVILGRVAGIDESRLIDLVNTAAGTEQIVSEANRKRR